MLVVIYIWKSIYSFCETNYKATLIMSQYVAVPYCTVSIYLEARFLHWPLGELG